MTKELWTAPGGRRSPDCKDTVFLAGLDRAVNCDTISWRHVAEGPRTARSQKPESSPGVTLPDWHYLMDSGKPGEGEVLSTSQGHCLLSEHLLPALHCPILLGVFLALEAITENCTFTQNGPQDHLHLSFYTGETESPISRGGSRLPFSVLGLRKSRDWLEKRSGRE